MVRDCTGNPRQPYKDADMARVRAAPAETPHFLRVSVNVRYLDALASLGTMDSLPPRQRDLALATRETGLASVLCIEEVLPGCNEYLRRRPLPACDRVGEGTSR